ncbi:MAG: hypothetical protein IJ751_07495 [Oscillospiraceae bacterium]|nr:hypothetical protein [Oscillospiraceae bacterium]
MDEKTEAPLPDPAPAQDPNKLLFVMLVVLIICGGNGLGILTAALIWRLTGLRAAAILAVVGITVVAFVCGMALIVFRNRKRK